MTVDDEPVTVSGGGEPQVGGWRYMTETEVEETNLLHGHYELVTIPHQEFLAREEANELIAS